MALAQHERGIERSLPLHDAACYEMLMSMHHNYCSLWDGEPVLASLPRKEVVKVLMVLGQLPPPDGIRIETPRDLTDADGRAAVLSFEMGFDPLLTGPEFWTMMARTTLALNERCGESIVGSWLWRDMAPRLYHRPTFEGLRLWLEALAWYPPPRPGGCRAWRRSAPYEHRPARAAAAAALRRSAVSGSGALTRSLPGARRRAATEA